MRSTQIPFMDSTQSHVIVTGQSSGRGQVSLVETEMGIIVVFPPVVYCLFWQALQNQKIGIFLMWDIAIWASRNMQTHFV